MNLRFRAPIILVLLATRWKGTDARLHELSVEPEARVRGLTTISACTLGQAGAVTYNGGAQVLYAVQENPDIVVSFKAPPVNPTTPPLESVEAVIWPGKKDGEDLSCDYNQPYYLGATAGASLNNPGTANTPFPTLWPVEIVPTGSNNYDVEIDTTFFTNPDTPGYSESGNTGWAYMCIEFQQFACDSKVDFATVLLEIKYNLESECSICSIAQITREGPVNDGGEVLAPPLECVVGNPGDAPFKQGDDVEICVQYPDDYRNDDVCFNYLDEFEAELWQTDGPDSVTADLLNIAGSGFQQIGDTTCLDQFDTEPSPPMYGRICCITIVPSPEWLQTIVGTANLRIDATLISTYQDCQLPARSLESDEGSHRHLEDAAVSRASVNVELSGSGSGTSCEDNFFLGLLQAILGWLLTLLGLDPFCV